MLPLKSITSKANLVDFIFAEMIPEKAILANMVPGFRHHHAGDRA